MAETTISTANRVKQWDSKFFNEYVRSNRFKRYMGASENAIIQINENLSKKKGDAITIPLLGSLDDTSYNDGSSDLVGNEKALPNDGHQISIGVVRDATVVNVEEEQASPINIRNAGKTALKTLAMRHMKNDIITALHTINGTAYGSATETAKDAWLVDNADRVLFGDAKGNNAANDHSVALATVTSSMVLDGDTISLHKRMIQTANNVNSDGIRPYVYGEDNETFVMFVPSLAFRDLRSWMVTNSYWENAMQRAKSNPLFSGPNSIEWDGVIVREIPELSVLSGVGAASINVAPCFMCGAQALGVAWAMRPKSTIRTEDDYGFKHGVGFMELRGIDKLQYGQGGSDAKDWGMGTLYVAGVADA
ncbi:MAG: DUF4043 family protein [Candidatus Thiodiazotropha sp.]